MNPLPPDPLRPQPPAPRPVGPPPAWTHPVPPTAPQAPASVGSGRGWKVGFLAVAVAAVAAVGLQFTGPATESNHPNWPQVREASARPPGQVRWQGADGAVAFLTAVPFADEDRDAGTTAAVKAALDGGDDLKAEQVVVAAQPAATRPPDPGSKPVPVPTPQPAATVPAPAPPPPAAQPTLTPGLKAEVRRGDAQFYHLYLYDSCDEDGDVVEVLLNGQPFRTVRLTNEGATLSVPVSADGTTTIQVRGVYDGGGGITVACRTSCGRGFLRVMAVGDVETLAVVRK